MLIKDFFKLPNLLSLSRIFMVPFIGYYISKGDPLSTVISLGIIALAGLTDGLDGFAARILNQKSRLGLILDPIADKIIAVALVILLILYRDFPLWLAIFILSRDLLILIASSTLMTQKGIVVPSNLTGKYAFASIVVLFASYITTFEFGITLMTPIVVIFLSASLMNYIITYYKIYKGIELRTYQNNKKLRLIRSIGSSVVIVLILYNFYFHFIELIGKI
ncbi:MAG: CDP-alcohol phosphatidyltransferase family protein [candidate division Zixibacteria bacterium]|nr:CDP-alcohol phosphatidyltransferase family protein [candidate division Zixibacteria bacterium]